MSSLQPAQGFEHRELFDDEHRTFRESFRRFLNEEVASAHRDWERAGIIPRALWSRAGELGFLAFAADERFGGAGVEDFRFNAVIGEEAQRAGVASFGVGLTNHSDVCLPYLLDHGTEEQRDRWLPGVVKGDLVTAIAMTEPGAGSDLGGIRTRGIREDGGWVVNGAKTFITCGGSADLVITVVRTNPEDRLGGLTLMVLEREMPGVSVGGLIPKIGLHAQDTAELIFTDVRVPDENVLGGAGEGFGMLLSHLPQERMTIAVAAVAAARGALVETIDYVRDRTAFGRPISDFQASRFSLAQMFADLEVGQAYIDQAIRDLVLNRLMPEHAAVAKLWATEMQGRVVDGCLQLHGGYGYTTEYPIGQRYVDARVTRLYGGTSEIMREIIGRALIGSKGGASR
ncbi:MAG: acyl-CoA dehydrogenase family protein [Solirubrobacterales bacterium]